MGGNRRGVPPSYYRRVLHGARKLYPGKPLFDVWLKKHHLQNPYYACMPVEIQKRVKRKSLSVSLLVGGKHGKQINTTYKASPYKKYFSIKELVEYAKVKVGDGLVFILQDVNNERLIFKVCRIESKPERHSSHVKDKRTTPPYNPIVLD